MDPRRLPGAAAGCNGQAALAATDHPSGVPSTRVMTAEPSNDQSVECRLKPDLERVPTTLAEMKVFFEERGLQAEAWACLELATAEAVNNAIEHGCIDQVEPEVICRWNWKDETIEIEITDPGKFQPP